MESPEEKESWTFVTTKKRRSAAQRKSKTHTPLAAKSPVHAPQPTQTRESYLTVAEIKADHQRIKEQWLNSSCCRNLKKLMTSREYDHVPSTAVCLGIGSFDPPDGSWQVKRRTHAQLAAFQTLLELLNERATEPIRCVFQEPYFTEADREFLEGMAYEIVDSPHGYKSVDEHTFLYGIHLYKETYSDAIADHIPAIFIGTGWDTWESCANPESFDWKRIEELDQVCDKVNFPKDEDFYPAFTSTVIHWRKKLDKPVVADDVESALEKLTLSET
ncbi:SRR1 [Apiospora saccharicola]|uniref:SRR1 n=1 Tax=Apiospora saccharicola TaxID=335842 RepID=A0ABR1VB04_9PEZI